MKNTKQIIAKIKKDFFALSETNQLHILIAMNQYLWGQPEIDASNIRFFEELKDLIDEMK